MNKYIGISKPLNVVRGRNASLDAKYGPYDSINHATSSIPIAVRRVGLTVGIIFLEGAVETVKDYWWKKGIEDTDLELKIDNAASTKTSQLENDADFQDGNQVSSSLQAQKSILDAVDINLQRQINTHSGQITTINQKNVTQDTQIQDIIASYIDNKGYFATLTSLQTSYPTPEVGDTAYVADALSSTGYYIYNVVNGVWTSSTVEAPPVAVPINDYTLSGGSTKTLKEVDDNASVKIKNEAENGNFENGLTWPFHRNDSVEGESTFDINSSTPISGNYDFRLTITTPAPAIGRPQLNGLNRAGNIGDKIYLHFYAKILSGTPIIGAISDGENARSLYGGDVINGRNTRIINVEGTSSSLGQIYFNSLSVWDIQMDNFMRINLTEAFGAGNEPTEEDMNLLLDIAGISYIDDEVIIPAQKIMQWQLKLTNTVAQNADDAVILVEEQVKEQGKDLKDLVDVIAANSNLFNSRDAKIGYGLNSSTGLEVESPLYALSNYMVVKPNTEYSISRANRAVLYNSNKEVISILSLSTSVNNIINTTVDTVYVRASYLLTNYTSGYLIEGVTNIYKPFVREIENLENRDIWSNLNKMPKDLGGWITGTRQTAIVKNNVLELGREEGYPIGTYSADFNTDIPANHSVYFRAELMTSNETFISVGVRYSSTQNTTKQWIPNHNTTLVNQWEVISGVIDDYGEGNYILNIISSNAPEQSNPEGKKLSVRNMALVDLTELKNRGFTITKNQLDEYFDNNILTIDDISEYTLLKWLDSENKHSFGALHFGLDIKTVEVPTSINTLSHNRLHLIATKKYNYHSAINPPIQDPQDVGFLYIEYGTDKLYYSEGKFDNPKYLCEWNKEIADNTDCDQWMGIITNDGDIVFLKESPYERYEPIVYPNGDYDNPIRITTNESYQPAGITTDTGACVSSFGDFFMFGEYMVNGHVELNGQPIRIWKVEKPYTQPENWRVVDSWYRSDTGGAWGQQPSRELSHFHTIAFDHYTGNWYANSGDANPFCRVMKSIDDGETWVEVASGHQKWRTLGYIFTEDACYWGTDTDGANHNLYKVNRDVNGNFDFANGTEVVAELSRTGQRTYNTCLVREPHGILLLDRAEPRNDGIFDVEFYSFEDEKIHTVGTYLNHFDIPENHPRYGFGNIACTYYQNWNEDGIICGSQGTRRNFSLKMLGSSPDNPLGVTEIKVVRK